jgi:hypothetical protein
MRTPFHAALALAWGLGLLAGAGASLPAARAQDLPAPGDGFEWERVGDVPIDPFGLAFGPDSTLWATGSDGPYRLDTTAGFPGTWVLLWERGIFTGPILALGRGPDGDTLLASTGRIHRSTDGGATWAEVRDLSGGGLYAMPQGYPFAGRVFAAGTSALPDAVGYSDDRGATFTDALMPGEFGAYADADAFAAYPPGSPWAGRILAAGRWGVNVSDDGGVTFRESGLWQSSHYVGEAVGIVARPDSGGAGGGGYNAVVGGWINGTSGDRAWVSADGGQTWGPPGGVLLPEGPPIGPGGTVAGVFPLGAGPDGEPGGPSALLVLGRGTVYRTDDAGQTWRAVGRAPEINEDIFLSAAALSPDGRLYVGLAQIGSERAWVYRTEPVPVDPPVPVEEGPEGGEPLGLEVSPNPFRRETTVTLTLARPSAVSAALYDTLGRRVAVLHAGPLGAGRHTLMLGGVGLVPGVYVVRAVTRDETTARAVTLLR